MIRASGDVLAAPIMCGMADYGKARFEALDKATALSWDEALAKDAQLTRTVAGPYLLFHQNGHHWGAVRPELQDENAEMQWEALTRIADGCNRCSSTAWVEDENGALPMLGEPPNIHDD